MNRPYTTSCILIQLLNELSVFPFDAQTIVFSVDSFLNPKFCFTDFLQLPFTDFSSSLFTIESTNNVCSWYSTFYFLDHKAFLRPIWRSDTLQKYFRILIFSHDHQL